MMNQENSDLNKMPKPTWFPSKNELENSNIAKFMKDLGFKCYEELHQYSVKNYVTFWGKMIEKLQIQLDRPYEMLVDLSLGIEKPQWLYGAKLNIANSCFQKNFEKQGNVKRDVKSKNVNDIAIISQSEKGKVFEMSYQALDLLSSQIAIALQRRFKKGDRIAIIMPMTHYAIAIYLGIIKAGCIAVSIADSFAAHEIEIRLKIAEAKAVFTQDAIIRDGKILPLYPRVLEAKAKTMIVLPALDSMSLSANLRPEDIAWQDFLVNTESELKHFTAVSCLPSDYINILFSSGTTGEPKAIPWTHSCPIKCASDAYFHHNILASDVFCWPTNLGWMMGPWLIFATLINGACIALYEGTPNGKPFGKFIQDRSVTLLGVVPTIVKTWRTSGCMEGLDWRKIKLFTSTGETSNAEDMQYLMNLAENKPVIEYCGGTEIAGAYVTGTVVEPQAPGACTTAAMGLDFVILDENGKPSLSGSGEVALIPPSMGLSNELLNKDHYEIYYADMPKTKAGIPLRRHGDQIEHFQNGFYCLHGRVDDTMKLSGIKVSSSEIEQLLNGLEGIFETAAIAVEPVGGGPSALVIYVVLKDKAILNEKNGYENQDAVNDLKSKLKSEMQQIIKQKLNPLFKIQEVVIVDALPRTASNKIMRRLLRNQHL